jgi:hypothetical protein
VSTSSSSSSSSSSSKSSNSSSDPAGVHAVVSHVSPRRCAHVLVNEYLHMVTVTPLTSANEYM